MKVVGVVGSTRPKGNTLLLMNETLGILQRYGIETELVNLANKDIRDCRGCLHCRRTGNCIQKDDLPEIFEVLREADGFILGSPVYFSSVTGLVKCFINRIGFLGGAHNRPFERKVGGAFTVARRAGHNFAFLELVAFLLHQGMVVPGSSYWNVAFGRGPGEAQNDEEGLATMRNFAENMAWTLQKLTS